MTSLSFWAYSMPHTAFPIALPKRSLFSCLRSSPESSSAKELAATAKTRSEEHTSELQSQPNLVCRLLLEKKSVRARLLGAAPPPEADRGGAESRGGRDAARGHRRGGRAAGRGDRLRRRRHDRVPARLRLVVLFHGNEHPHPGRAPGYRDVNELRPRERADPRRGRTAVVARDGRPLSPRPCHRL